MLTGVNGGIDTSPLLRAGVSALPDELYGQCFQENSSGWIAEVADLQRHLEAVTAP